MLLDVLEEREASPCCEKEACLSGAKTTRRPRSQKRKGRRVQERPLLCQLLLRRPMGRFLKGPPSAQRPGTACVGGRKSGCFGLWWGGGRAACGGGGGAAAAAGGGGGAAGGGARVLPALFPFPTTLAILWSQHKTNCAKQTPKNNTHIHKAHTQPPNKANKFRTQNQPDKTQQQPPKRTPGKPPPRRPRRGA